MMTGEQYEEAKERLAAIKAEAHRLESKLAEVDAEENPPVYEEGQEFIVGEVQEVTRWVKFEHRVNARSAAEAIEKVRTGECDDTYGGDEYGDDDYGESGFHCGPLPGSTPDWDKAADRLKDNAG